MVKYLRRSRVLARACVESVMRKEHAGGKPGLEEGFLAFIQDFTSFVIEQERRRGHKDREGKNEDKEDEGKGEEDDEEGEEEKIGRKDRI